MKIKPEDLELLLGMGLTRLEAVVYCTLLEESALSGYQIAKLTSKSRSNVYQALRSLERSGAVVRLQGCPTRSYRATPVDEFLKLKEREFDQRREKISQVFRDLDRVTEQEEIYGLGSMSQVYTKANEIIESTEKIIFVETQLIHFGKIRKSLQGAVKRGVKVIIYSSDVENAPGCDIIRIEQITPAGMEYEPWSVNWFCLAADGSQFLISTTRKQKEELINALYSSNRYIAGWIFSDMLYQIGFNHIVSMFGEGLSREEIWQWIGEYINSYVNIAPGILKMRNGFKEDAEEI